MRRAEKAIWVIGPTGSRPRRIGERNPSAINSRHRCEKQTLRPAYPMNDLRRSRGPKRAGSQDDRAVRVSVFGGAVKRRFGFVLSQVSEARHGAPMFVRINGARAHSPRPYGAGILWGGARDHRVLPWAIFLFSLRENSLRGASVHSFREMISSGPKGRDCACCIQGPEGPCSLRESAGGSCFPTSLATKCVAVDMGTLGRAG